MTVAVIALALCVAALGGALVYFGKVAIDRTAETGKAQVERAVAAGRAENAEAALETSERFRQQERKRAAALEEEIHALEAEPVVPGPARDARNRLLQKWRQATDHDAVDAGTGAAGAGNVVSGTITVPARAGERAEPDSAGDADRDPGVRR